MKQIIISLWKRLSSSVDSSFEIIFWDGDKKKFGNGKPKFRLILKNERAAKRLLHGVLGATEEYMDGNIIIEGDLQEALRLQWASDYQKLNIPLKDKIRLVIAYITSLNTLIQARKNVRFHYDLGNDFFALQLDKDMTCSAAYFKTYKESLEQAQNTKFEYICKKLQLKKGEKLVDIGCGWGAMLIYAAKNYGVKGVGYTLSENQHQYALDRIKEEGLKGKIKIYLKDYREAKGKFDKFVSFGMFEHVGKEFSHVYFEKVNQLLKSKGMGILMTMGKDYYSPMNPFIVKYIFPGTWVPLVYDVLKDMGNNRLLVTDVENTTLQHHLTYNEWARRFDKNLEKVKKMGLDQKFINMWRLYLHGVAASFRYGEMRHYRITFIKGIPNSPLLPSVSLLLDKTA